jgi:hypothetical protein
LSEAQKAAPEALADSDIDYRDLPALPEEFGQNAQHGRFYKAVKQQLTARLDTDVLAWLKSAGKGLSGSHERDPAPRNTGLCQRAASRTMVHDPRERILLSERDFQLVRDLLDNPAMQKGASSPHVRPTRIPLSRRS